MVDNNPVLTSRLTFPEDRTTFVYGPPGTPIRTPPRTGVKVFLDEACTTPANVLALTGGEIPYSTIYTGEDGLLPEFLGPPGFLSTLWARVVGGTVAAYRLNAQYSEQIATLPMIYTGSGPPSVEIGAAGSFYIDQDIDEDPNTPPDVKIYGPRTVDGWPEEGVPLKGPPGPPGSKRVWNQPSPAETWNVVHDLPGAPSVSIVNSANEIVIADVRYHPSDPQRLFIDFGAPESGIAILT